MRETLNKKLKEKGFLIAAHRGTFGANIIDNTFLSMKLALELGADMVEIDVTKSKDGKLFAFHSGLEKKRFGKDIDLHNLDSKEIEKLEYLNHDDVPSGNKIEYVKDILLKLKGKALVNIDRAWDYFPEVFELVKELNMEDQIIVKSTPKEHVLEFLKKDKQKLMFMPIVRSIEDLKPYLDEGINTVAVEVLFDREDHELNSKEFKKMLKDRNILLWVNTIKLDTEDIHNFAAGHYDDNALEDNGSSWEWVVNQGVDIIQTDWPYFLNKFRNKN